MVLFLFHTLYGFAYNIYELFCVRQCFFFVRNCPSQGVLHAGEAEPVGSELRGLSHRPHEHDVQYGYYQRVALLIV